MAERSFKKEVELLRLRAGQEFKGEGILAVTKALLQSGVSYIAGYQGAPISHLVDVLSDAADILDELGIRFEMSANEATAAATLAASVNYPLRGAVTFKGSVGTNVASDALANLSSSGVTGGALIILGEDYGEGSSIMQERSHAFAMKSQIWLLDPRPNLPSIVKAVETGFRLSEASNTPVMLELRIRACHVYGSFTAQDNVRPAFTIQDARNSPQRKPDRIVLPPASYLHEREKIEQRWPAAVKFIEENQLNEVFDGDTDDIGIVVQGGIYNTLMRALQTIGLADAFGETRVPLYVLNVTYPLVDSEIIGFCTGKRAILLVEEGQPEFIEHSINTVLRRAAVQTRCEGKSILPLAGEYTGAVIKAGLVGFLRAYRPDLLPSCDPTPAKARIEAAVSAIGPNVQGRPPSFCTGCPERPIFAAIKLAERELGQHHVSCDIGCHLFSTFPPFEIGNTVMGYGLGGAGASALGAAGDKRAIAILGDGGFWHNGLVSSVGNTVFNKNDGVQIIIDNGYSAATGGQDIMSSEADNRWRATRNTIERAVRGVGVRWTRTISNTYDVARVRDTLKEALLTITNGPKVIIARSECMLNKQRRERPLLQQRMKTGLRTVRERFGVDHDTCTGDHSCIRLSGCPSLTVAPNPNPLRREPVTKVLQSCVGCGLCGEIAHAAVLCPSFYRASIVSNPSRWERARPSSSGRDICLAAASRQNRHGRSPDMTMAKPINIAILAMGGEGGGVLADWLVRLGESGGYLAQTTSVPGVSQRTGATIYYLELFPRSALRDRGPMPVLGLMPMPGDIDLVVASELMEAGRAIQRGLVTPDRTHLLASTHRVYSMTERTALGDGRVDAEAIVEGCSTAALKFTGFDMARLAEANKSVISAALLGAIAGSQALPFAREAYEAAIRNDGVGVNASLAAFAAAFAAAEGRGDPDPTPNKRQDRTLGSLDPALSGIRSDEARTLIMAGVDRTADYQDNRYAQEYIERLNPFVALAECQGDVGEKLLSEVARQLALGMTYEDTVRVAELKIRGSRFDRVCAEVGADADQIVEIVEFMHPRVEEIADTMPTAMGRWLLRSKPARTLVTRLTSRGRMVRTTSLRGFLLLYCVASLKPFRRGSLRYDREMRFLAEWLETVRRAAGIDVPLAIGLAHLRNLVKGYGDTCERGRSRYQAIYSFVSEDLHNPSAAAHLRALTAAADKDEDGAALCVEIDRLSRTRRLEVADIGN